jgi:hypothetical protein
LQKSVPEAMRSRQNLKFTKAVHRRFPISSDIVWGWFILTNESNTAEGGCIDGPGSINGGDISAGADGVEDRLDKRYQFPLIRSHIEDQGIKT